MDDIAKQPQGFVFGGFMLDETRAALIRGSEEVHLRRQSFEVLRYLVRNANRLVTKEELFAAVWPGSVVTDDSLTQCLVEIRRAIGDDGHEIIRTVPRRGYVLDIPVSIVADEAGPGRAAAALPRRRGSRWPRWLTFAALALAGAGSLWWAAERSTERTDETAAATDAARDVSIAVLPFVDLSDGQDQQYFAEGLSEEILNLLAQLPDLRVIARTSSFSFGARSNLDIPEIGRRLGVTHLLEGSVRRSGDRVRVTAQFVRASDGSHLWSRAYDREVGDVLEVQREIAASVARTLEIRFAEPASRTGGRAVDPAAHEQYLLSRFLWSRRASGDLGAAQAHLERAVSLDPNHAQAWALLSGVRYIRIFEDGKDPAAGLEAMRVAIGRALALAPESGEVQARAAQYYSAAGDFRRQADHWERALALAPGNMLVVSFSMGDAMARGEFAEALRHQRRAAQLDPVGFVTRRNLAVQLMINGRYEESWRELQRASQLNPDPAAVQDLVAEILVLRGRHAEALEAAVNLPAGPARDRLLVLAYDGLGRQPEADAALAALRTRGDPESLRRIAEVYAWRGKRDAAFEWLERAWHALSAAALVPGERARLTNFLDSGFLRPLHGDPRLERYFVHPGGDAST